MLTPAFPTRPSSDLAMGPEEALLAILHEAGGNQATPEAAVHVDRMITGLEQAQPELGILADAPLGPAADAVQSIAANQRHRAVLDDRIAQAALHHAEIAAARITSEESREGKECGSPCRARRWPSHKKKNNK